jgi:hypothetical protein
MASTHKLVPVGNVPNVSGLAPILGCRDSLPMKYLGLLLDAPLRQSLDGFYH